MTTSLAEHECFSDETLLDNVISLIRRIDGVLSGRFGGVELLVRNRGSEGRFPDETFY